jgi:hypothetical protein
MEVKKKDEEIQWIWRSMHVAADDEPLVVLGHLLEGVHLGRHDLHLPRESSSAGDVCGGVT